MAVPIDVCFAGDDTLISVGTMPVLTWELDPEHGYGWICWWRFGFNPEWPVLNHFVGGDVSDVDQAVAVAQAWFN